MATTRTIATLGGALIDGRCDLGATVTRDLRLLFLTRALRMFAYGGLSVVLLLYLREVGLSSTAAGWLIGLTLAGDTLISLGLTAIADRWGRRRVLICGAGLMLLAGVVFAVTSDFHWLLLAAIVGVISPSGSEVGPFLAVEQAALSQPLSAQQRTTVFAWYHLTGYVATALGALAGGGLTEACVRAGWTELAGYRAVFWLYGGLGAALLIGFLMVSPAVELPVSPDLPASDRTWFGLRQSRKIVLKLSALFALDAFGGGFAMQTMLAYWFHQRFKVDPGLLGVIFLSANLVAACSALSASRLAQRFGLVQTMVFTHLPSNVLLMLVPLMPTLPWALAVLLLRFSISQMDVPTRQSYTMAVVSAEERAAAAGVTNVARSLGAALAPILGGSLLQDVAWMPVMFYLAGGIKIVYDLWLYREFVHHQEVA